MAKPPFSSPQSQTSALDARIEQAMFALQRDRPAEAERIANDILKTNHHHRRALQVQGYALLMQGRAQEAVAALERAVRGAADPEAETQLAIALRRCGRMEEALAVLKGAIKRRPPFAAAFHELGFLLFKLNRHQEAARVLERGLELAPDVPDLSSQLGYIFLALSDRTQARTAFARALAVSPRHPDALFGIANVLFEGGEFAQAAGAIQTYLSVRPNDTEARIKLGACLLELGQPEAAYSCLRAATRAGPKYAGKAIAAMVRSGHGRFWLRPSAAARFFRNEKA